MWQVFVLYVFCSSLTVCIPFLRFWAGYIMPFMSYSHVLELRRWLEGTRANVICYGSQDYAEKIKRWSDTCERDAGAIVEVTSTSEVSEAVQFARKHHINFVTEAGGHSTTGSSATHGGLVISLTKMRRVLTDPASRTVCVQGGAIWDDVNESTAAYGLAVVGSTASHTGVAGTTLGGGFGWLTGRYGLISDNLLSVKMVLADGTIVEASDEDHQDLFWAVRGAGQAFGIVTELGFRAYELAGPVYGGTLIFTVDRLPGILEFASRFDELQDENSGLFFGLAAPSAADRTGILVLPFYNGSQEKAEEFFAPLMSLGPSINKTSMMSYKELNRIANVDPVPEGRKCFSGTKVSMPLDQHLLCDLWEHFDAIMDKYPRSNNSVLMFELIPYGKTISVPIDATACADRGRYYNVALLLCWYDPEHDAAMHTYMRALLSRIKRSDCFAGKKEPVVQANANFAGHEIGATYLFRDNLPRLQALKRKYDPHNVFSKWHDLVSHTERQS